MFREGVEASSNDEDVTVGGLNRHPFFFLLSLGWGRAARLLCNTTWVGVK